MSNQRFYVAQTSGYPTARAVIREHEYAVVDSETSRVVAVFLACQSQGSSDKAYARLKRRAHLRARDHCVSLNRLPATNGVALVA